MILLWAFAFNVGATTVSLDNGVGSDYLSSQLATDGYLGSDKSLTGALSYGYARVEQTGTTGPFDDVTNTFGGSLNWTPELMQFRAGGSIANTPAENLTARTFTLDGGYRGDQWKWKLGGGTTYYAAGYRGVTQTKKGKPRTTTGTEVLQQRFLRFDLRWRPVSRLSLRSALTVYGYSRDVPTFEANLDTPAAVRRGTDGFGGVVGGLPASAVLLEGVVDLDDDWDFTLTHTISRLAVGGGQRSFVTRAEFGVDLNRTWHLDFGAERDQSAAFTDTLGLFGVDVTF